MNNIFYNGKLYKEYVYSTEKEFEKIVVEHSDEIFGKNSIYFNIKKAIGDDIVSIPDGYLLDFTFDKNPNLYIIEVELSSHDPYKHIGQQLLRFAISYKASGRKIKKELLKEIYNDIDNKMRIEEYVEKSRFRNVDELLDHVIFENPVYSIVIIDELRNELQNVLSQLTMKSDILEFESYVCENDYIHRFTPFQQDLQLDEINREDIDADELDTIIVPANEEGFNEVFLGENCWYSIRISSSMIDRIKYIAGYQTAPISSITYYAEVLKIEKYKDTGKYIIYFKENAKKITPITLGAGQGKARGKTPQSPRYTTYERLMKSKTLNDLY